MRAGKRLGCIIRSNAAQVTAVSKTSIWLDAPIQWGVGVERLHGS